MATKEKIFLRFFSEQKLKSLQIEVNEHTENKQKFYARAQTMQSSLFAKVKEWQTGNNK